MTLAKNKIQLAISPLWVCLSLLLWGWQSEQVFIGIAIGGLLLGSLLPWKHEFPPKEILQVRQLCFLFVIGLVIYIALNVPGKEVMYFFIRWSPIALSPWLLARYYSVDPFVFRSFSKIDFAFLYLILCHVAAGMGLENSDLYSFSLFALWAGILWQHRPQRYSLPVWISLFSIACLIGFFGNQETKGLIKMYQKWIFSWIYSDYNPNYRTTAIGSIGELKFSNQIVLRIRPEQGKMAPQLLRNGAYNTYMNQAWWAKSSPFLAYPNQLETEDFSEQKDSGLYSLQIYQNLSRSEQKVPLPQGTTHLFVEPTEGLSRNVLGSILLEEASPTKKELSSDQENEELPNRVKHRIQYFPQGRLNSSSKNLNPEKILGPNEDDLNIPDSLQKTIRQIWQEIDQSSTQSQSLTKSQSLTESKLSSIQKIEDYFSKGFSYSLKLQESKGKKLPLENFLLQEKQGHCEYYATASVLLLRAAGIPARYATGYSVSEFSRLEGLFLARESDAHAWALAFVDGKWVNVDNTPSIWLDELNKDSWITQIADFFSWLRFLFFQWQIGEVKVSNLAALPWGLAFLLTLFLLYRLRKWKWLKSENSLGSLSTKFWKARKIELAGLESQFEQFLAQEKRLGRDFHSGETVRQWAQRHQEHFNEEQQRKLEEMIDLYYRSRFDPLGLSQDEKERFHSLLKQSRER